MYDWSPIFYSKDDQVLINFNLQGSHCSHPHKTFLLNIVCNMTSPLHTYTHASAHTIVNPCAALS